tara:strand:- start:145 stop:417 length:273 start_codon:yes stop_codon:yes gene_type:complete
MTEQEIVRIAIKMADIVIKALERKQLEWDSNLIAELQEFVPHKEETEQELLSELAKYMTMLDYELQNENYRQCEVLKNKIKSIETKLNNL